MGPPTVDLPLVAILASCALVAWRVHVRVRRFVGRQRFRPLRAWISVTLFVFLVVVLLIGSIDRPAQTVAELLGAAIGIGLATYGLRLTKFEPTPTGLYCTPNIRIGIVLSLLLAARIAYRLVQSYISTAAFTEPPTDFVRSPLTLLLVGTLAGYYAWYSFGLLRRHRSLGR